MKKFVEILKKIAFWLVAGIVLIGIAILIILANTKQFGNLPFIILVAIIFGPIVVMGVFYGIKDKLKSIRNTKLESMENEAFGSVKNMGSLGWETKNTYAFELFGKTYNVKAKISTDETEFISEIQEKAFKAFFDIIKQDRDKIEKAIIEHFNYKDDLYAEEERYQKGYNLSDFGARFKPESIEVFQNGYCALYADDDAEDGEHYDELGEGFVLQLIPEIKVYTCEMYTDYLHYSINH